MALIDELKERLSYKRKTIQHLEAQLDEMQEEAGDLDCAIAALEPPAEAAPEPDEQASAQPDPAEGTPVPGTGEESRDQLCSVEGCEIHADDASEFAEEGYAPVIEADPVLVSRNKFIVAEPAPELTWTVPLNPESYEPEPTKPEADSIAKALDHYDRKAMAERDRFNPFNIFKREGDQ